MNNELTDSALDAAAKELLTDAPDELLKGVMYLIEKDAAPKRRFAFGHFTMFGAVAAAVIIIIGMRYFPENKTGGELISFDTSMNTMSGSAAPAAEAPAAAPAPQAMSEPEMTISGKTVPDMVPATESGSASDALADENARKDAGSSPAFGEPVELSPLEQAFYDWVELRADELISISEVSRTDSEIVAIVEYESETLEVTVTENNGEFEITTSRGDS